MLDLVRGVKARLTTYGFDVDALFSQAGLNESDCTDGDALTLSDKLSHLWELLAKVSGDPCLGLKVSSPHPSGWLGLMGHIMLGSPDVKTAIESLVRYTPLVSGTVHSTLEHSAGRTRVALHLPAGERKVPQQRYDFVFCMLLRTLRFAAARKDLKPVLVTYTYAKPNAALAQAYADKFGCEVRFGMAANAMEFADADLEAPIPTAHPMAADWTLRMVAELAQSQRISTTCSAKVQRILVELLAKGEPQREEVAKRLMMSERTLQRRLSEEGTNFTQLVDDTRREMARRYLNNGQLSLKKLSFQLGFSEPSAFYRACKRWFGQSPKQLQQGAA